MDFSVIAQDPQVRAIVQENALERAFHDMLFPNMIFRLDVEPVQWEAQTGDNRSFSAPGPIAPDQGPIVPGQDLTVASWQTEQWTAQMAKYGKSIDSPMPTSISAIVKLYLRNAQQLGLHAAQTMNRIVRNRLYNGALSGQTTVITNIVATNKVHVDRINGFLTARRPDLAGGSQVQFAPVSASNPLGFKAGPTFAVVGNVIAVTPDNAGDTVGPGVLTLDGNYTLNARDPFYSTDASFILRSGGGTRTDDIGNTDLLTLALVQQAVAYLRNSNVPPHADGSYHCHLDPVSEYEVFQDDALQRLLRSLPEYYMTQDFVLGKLYGTIFFRNSESPQGNTVQQGTKQSPNYTDGKYNPLDPFGAPVFSDTTTAGTPMHYPLVTGGGWMNEYYADMGALITEAGLNGKVGKWQITNNGIDVMVDRVKMILRAPLNRSQDEIATSWVFMGDWPIRTDALTGGAARMKRGVVIESA